MLGFTNSDEGRQSCAAAALATYDTRTSPTPAAYHPRLVQTWVCFEHAPCSSRVPPVNSIMLFWYYVRKPYPTKLRPPNNWLKSGNRLNIYPLHSEILSIIPRCWRSIILIEFIVVLKKTYLMVRSVSIFNSMHKWSDFKLIFLS